MKHPPHFPENTSDSKLRLSLLTSIQFFLQREDAKKKKKKRRLQGKDCFTYGHEQWFKVFPIKVLESITKAMAHIMILSSVEL